MRRIQDNANNFMSCTVLLSHFRNVISYSLGLINLDCPWYDIATSRGLFLFASPPAEPISPRNRFIDFANFHPAIYIRFCVLDVNEMTCSVHRRLKSDNTQSGKSDAIRQDESAIPECNLH